MAVEISTLSTLATVRELVREEFDDDQLPPGVPEGTAVFFFLANGVKVSTKQEAKKHPWDMKIVLKPKPVAAAPLPAAAPILVAPPEAAAERPDACEAQAAAPAAAPAVVEAAAAAAAAAPVVSPLAGGGGGGSTSCDAPTAVALTAVAPVEAPAAAEVPATVAAAENESDACGAPAAAAEDVEPPPQEQPQEQTEMETETEEARGPSVMQADANMADADMADANMARRAFGAGSKKKGMGMRPSAKALTVRSTSPVLVETVKVLPAVGAVAPADPPPVHPPLDAIVDGTDRCREAAGSAACGSEEEAGHGAAAESQDGETQSQNAMSLEYEPTQEEAASVSDGAGEDTVMAEQPAVAELEKLPDGAAEKTPDGGAVSGAAEPAVDDLARHAESFETSRVADEQAQSNADDAAHHSASASESDAEAGAALLPTDSDADDDDDDDDDSADGDVSASLEDEDGAAVAAAAAQGGEENMELAAQMSMCSSVMGELRAVLEGKDAVHSPPASPPAICGAPLSMLDAHVGHVWSAAVQRKQRYGHCTGAPGGGRAPQAVAGEARRFVGVGAARDSRRGDR